MHAHTHKHVSVRHCFLRGTKTIYNIYRNCLGDFLVLVGCSKPSGLRTCATYTTVPWLQLPATFWHVRYRNTNDYHASVQCELAGWNLPIRRLQLLISPPRASRRPSPETELRLSPSHVAPPSPQTPSSPRHLYSVQRLLIESTIFHSPTNRLPADEDNLKSTFRTVTTVT